MQKAKSFVECMNPNAVPLLNLLEKSNPYHDSKGRFPSSGGASSFTYKPGQGKAYDKAIHYEKMEGVYASAKQNEPAITSMLTGISSGIPGAEMVGLNFRIKGKSEVVN